MEIDELLGPLLGTVVGIWLCLPTYSMFLACWFPKRAGGYWLTLVNGFGKGAFKLMRWGSLLLLINFSLGSLLAMIELLVAIRRLFAD